MSADVVMGGMFTGVVLWMLYKGIRLYLYSASGKYAADQAWESRLHLGE